MLNDIQKAEKEAKETLEQAKGAAEDTLQDAREEAVRIVKNAEEKVRELKSVNVNEGKETGTREAQKITAQAETEIKAQEVSADAQVKKAVESVMKHITENL